MNAPWRRTASVITVATMVLLASATSAYAISDATVVRTTIGSGIGFHSGYATCPAGEDATGGGVALSGSSRPGSSETVSDSGPVSSSGDFASTTTGTVPVQWYGTAYIESGVSSAYVWAVCSTTRTTVVRKTIASGTGTGFRSGSARCPAGKDATGGGLGINGGSGSSHYQFLSDDGPMNSRGSFVATTTATVPIQWYGTGFIQTPGTTSYVWAVCGHLATTVVRKTISSGVRIGFHAGYARCPSGQRGTGGGLAMGGGSSARDYQHVNDTGPVNSSEIFDGTTTGTIPIAWYATGLIATTGSDAYAWVVCG